MLSRQKFPWSCSFESAQENALSDVPLLSTRHPPVRFTNVVEFGCLMDFGDAHEEKKGTCTDASAPRMLPPTAAMTPVPGTIAFANFTALALELTRTA